jgi:hypothetical protein
MGVLIKGILERSVLVQKVCTVTPVFRLICAAGRLYNPHHVTSQMNTAVLPCPEIKIHNV